MNLFHYRAGFEGGGSAEVKGLFPGAAFLSRGADEVLRPMLTTFLCSFSRSQVIYSLSEGLKLA